MTRKIVFIFVLFLLMQHISIIPTTILAEHQLMNDNRIEDNPVSAYQQQAPAAQAIDQSAVLYAKQLRQWTQQFPSYQPLSPSKFVQPKRLASSTKPSAAVSMHNNEIYKLQPKYLTNNFSFSMIASTITDQNTVISAGNFRTRSDLSGMSWESQDHYSHPDLKYPTDANFSNLTLTYTYYLYGDVPAMNATLAPVLTVETNSGEVYYVRLWNYVVNRAQDDWEAGAHITFPAGRTAGSATGTTGNIEIDFNNLYAGWQPYVQESKLTTDGTQQYSTQWVKNKDWKKVPVQDIKKLMWTYVPKEYDVTATDADLHDSKSFLVKMTDWTVTGAAFLRTEPDAKPAQKVRITDDYDDIYNLTPERVVSDYQKLGFTGWVTMYVGASHYYDKKYVNGTMQIITDHPFNAGFEQWYDNYIQRLQQHHFKLIHSISMENVDAPAEWWQRTWNNIPATSGWTPPPHLLSFTNKAVQQFYKSYVNELAQMSVNNGMQPMIQLGEPWWWFMEGMDNKPPAFYDQATRDLYKKETGKAMYEFKSSNESIKGHEDLLYWLRDKNGEFSLMLRDELKKNNPNAQFTVLFFTPSVVDQDRVPAMMRIVNFPYKQWKYPNLDFFMLEDYDYLIDDRSQKHRNTLTYVQAHLGYPAKLIHYFSGYVSDRQHLEVWNNINQAINDGFNQGFGEVYVWAYAQVKRDGWVMPDMIMASKPTGLYEQPFELSLTTTADQIRYTTDGSVPTLTHGTVYSKPLHIAAATTIKAGVVKNGVITQIYDFAYDIGIK
ncbi:chitobiase/beta-hexosaminidase C-terminal domain-containing protein [Paenibacillus campi]|uniref:chitobiase/beta-hexosaminidase C-terminal domain-containing protein n=1 Tax=Paenibacillus campi TaxID=3106031 RepID=UPI002AFFBB34|nr:chitobiase/beta-hexosaminidase C-terminal domain-containing protein [Paenibacillus sp. SGZ-1014]